MYTRWGIVLLFLISAECSNKLAARHNSKKESNHLKLTKGLRSRGEIMDNLFVIYDPSFLAIVWPKITNGVHLSMEGPCWVDMSVFLKDLTEGRAWAYRTADASGRYPAGLFAGNHFWLGSKEQCLTLDHKFVSTMSNDTWGLGLYSRDYLTTVLKKEKVLDESTHEWQSLVERDELLQRVVAADNAPPFRLAYTSLQLDLNVTKFTLSESFAITLGVCLPRSCSPEDVISIVNFSIMLNDNLKSNKSTARTIRIRSLRQVEAQYDLKNDLGAVLTILITILLVLLAIIATIVDMDWVRFRPYPAKSTTFDLQKYNNTNIEGEKRFVEDIRRQHVADVLQEAKTYKKRIEFDVHVMNNLNMSSVNIANGKRKADVTPSITLDVVKSEGALGSCLRCGKYKKQCPNPKQPEHLGPCPRLKYNSCASLNTEYKSKNHLFKNLLLSFSLRHSWNRIFNTTMANKDLAFVHLLRIIVTLWVIFIHVALLTNYLADSGGSINEHNNVYYIMTTGTLAFDTLFFVSGLFSAHHLLYLKSQFSLEELVGCGGHCGRAMQFFCFITNRTVRLLPPYMFAILVSAAAARAARDTAALALPERDASACERHWWRNVLYLTTLYPRDQQCMQISWYLSTETQLYAVGVALCLLVSASRRRAAALLAVAATLAATGFDVTAAFTDYGHRLGDVFAAYATFVSRPAARVAAYCAGAAAGGALHRLDGTPLRVSKVTSGLLWAASTALAAACVAAPALPAGEAAAAAAAAAHLAWPLALIWPTLLCCTRYSRRWRGALEGARGAALSRLSYCLLLAHGPAARALLLQADAPLCGYTPCILAYFAGTAALTLLAALLLALLVEMPCCCLLRRLSDCARS